MRVDCDRCIAANIEIMYEMIRKTLFYMPPELAHDLALRSLCYGHALRLSERFVHPIYHPVTVMGLKFRNRVGLAAGLDKDGRCINGLLAMGFGFVEIGTVTPAPQGGNPKPRLFRLPEHRALLNRMGFNNRGMAVVAERLRVVREQRMPSDGLIGVNIGKNMETPLARAVEDYLAAFDGLHEHADYIAVNISSPNTPGLRELQEGRHLMELLGQLKRRQGEVVADGGRYVPLAAKIAPDLDNAAIATIAEVLLELGIDAVIATNTTVSRPLHGAEASRFRNEQGGISGEPLFELALKCVRQLDGALGGKIPIIGVGGIHDVTSARRMIDAGASLIQLYTGFIYQGPELVRSIACALPGDDPRELGADTDLGLAVKQSHT
jgi:dihydroorotate dehydrogenase